MPESEVLPLPIGAISETTGPTPDVIESPAKRDKVEDTPPDEFYDQLADVLEPESYSSEQENAPQNVETNPKPPEVSYEEEVVRKVPNEIITEAVGKAGKKVIEKVIASAIDETGSKTLLLIKNLKQHPEELELWLQSHYKRPLEIILPDGSIKYVLKIIRSNKDGSFEIEIANDVLDEKVKAEKLNPEEKAIISVESEVIFKALYSSDEAILEIVKGLSESEKIVVEEYIKRLEPKKADIFRKRAEREINDEKKKELQEKVDQWEKIDGSPEMIAAVELVLRENGIITAGRLIEKGIKPELIKDTILITELETVAELFDLTPENLQSSITVIEEEIALFKLQAENAKSLEEKNKFLSQVEHLETLHHERDTAITEIPKVLTRIISGFNGDNPELSQKLDDIQAESPESWIVQATDEILKDMFPSEKNMEDAKGFLAKHGKTIGKFSLLAALGLMYALMKSGKEQPQGYQ